MNTPQARQRALLILQVQAGQLTATAAARQLGLSRKSYYQWENRALAALMTSLETQSPGRPPKAADPEKEQLRQQVTRLQAQVTELEQVLELRQIRQQLRTSDAKKKDSRSCIPSSSKPASPKPPLASAGDASASARA
jgi:transposase